MSSVSLSSLRVGDLIESVTELGFRTFESIIDLSHSSTDETRVLLLEVNVTNLAANVTLQLTRDHMIYVRKENSAFTDFNSNILALELTFQGGLLIPARLIVQGDLIALLSPIHPSIVSWHAVNSIRDVIIEGVRNPWTTSGRFVVEGVVVSPFREETYHTYIQIQKQAHTWLGWTQGCAEAAETDEIATGTRHLHQGAPSSNTLHSFVHKVYMSVIEMYYSSIGESMRAWAPYVGTAFIGTVTVALIRLKTRKH